MMGNEFSGNGCRAAAFSFLKSTVGKINISASGSLKPIPCSIDNCGNSTAKIPYIFSPKNIIDSKFGFLIKMFGSYLLVIKGRGSYSQAQKIIDSQFPDCEAVGIMYYQKQNAGYKINPYFWVKNTDTLVNETACGSGSVALAIYLSCTNRKSFKSLNIVQLSGQPIFVNTKFTAGKVSDISISGPTELLGNYNVKI